mmetsp:Transcript_504/g.667  ORF Transcript_504/g.667 Transcript_504/m.667 type:complete len:223 (-) Transcript_504:7-675(-)
MWLLVGGFLFVFLCVWLAIFADHSLRDPRFNGSVDVAVVEFYAHCFCWVVLLLYSCVYSFTVELFECSWEYIVLACFVVRIITESLKWVDQSSMMMRMLANLGLILRSILLLRALIFLWDSPIVWPVIRHYGWTGDFRGMMMFVIPVYNCMFVSQNPTLSVIPVAALAISFLLHIVLSILGISFGIQRYAGIWITIILANIASLMWSAPNTKQIINSLSQSL